MTIDPTRTCGTCDLYVETAPLAIDLFCGLGGWSEGLLAEGWRVVGFDIERHAYGSDKYPGQLVLQDVLTIHGSQFRGASLIVASPPCQEFSYMAMPWTRAKQIAAGLRGRGDFPEGYKGSRTIKDLTALFDSCFRIQREACEAAGRHIPMVVENVRGAQPWVGKARANYGSFYLWGDVPALMPIVKRAAFKGGDRNKGRASGSHEWNTGFDVNATKVPGFRFDGSGGSFQTAAVDGTTKNPVHRQISEARRAKHYDKTEKMAQAGADAVKQAGISGPRDNGKGDAWFQDGAARHGSKSSARKAASARIAKIPIRLGRHIAAFYRPEVAA